MINNSRFHKSQSWSPLRKKSGNIFGTDTTPPKDKRYDLIYRNEFVLRSVHYAICKAKIKELVKLKTHIKNIFKIKRVK